MGTHPIFESDFDCLTDCVVVEKIIATIIVKLHKRELSKPQRVTLSRVLAGENVTEKKTSYPTDLPDSLILYLYS